MWRHLTYRAAKSRGKENPLMKPRPNNGRRMASSDVREYKIGTRKENPLMKPHPNNGRRMASSDVREYKIGIRGGKWRYLTYKSSAKSGFSLRGEQVGLPRRQCRRELKYAPVRAPVLIGGVLAPVNRDRVKAQGFEYRIGCGPKRHSPEKKLRL